MRANANVKKSASEQTGKEDAFVISGKLGNPTSSGKSRKRRGNEKEEYVDRETKEDRGKMSNKEDIFMERGFK